MSERKQVFIRTVYLAIMRGGFLDHYDTEVIVLVFDNLLAHILRLILSSIDSFRILLSEMLRALLITYYWNTKNHP